MTAFQLKTLEERPFLVVLVSLSVECIATALNDFAATSHSFRPNSLVIDERESGQEISAYIPNHLPP